jgi:uncharacterized damage-inducible protein DinB
MMAGMGISVAGLVLFVDRAVDGMAVIVRDLGDDLANRRPDLAGANSPYAILRHSLGVMEFWGGHVVAGRVVTRNRAAEFTASGPAADLVEAAERAKRQFRADAAAADPDAPPRRFPPDMQRREIELTTQGHALLHVLEEVTQHHGQAELTRDILRSAHPADGRG